MQKYLRTPPPKLVDTFRTIIFLCVSYVIKYIHTPFKMLRSKELLIEIKGQIIGMVDSGKSARQIGSELGIADTMISYSDCQNCLNVSKKSINSARDTVNRH